MAWRVWQLKQLEEKYNELLQSIYKKDMLGKEDRINLQIKFEEILLDDPLLPRELLPGDWIGFKVRKLILNK